MDSLRTVCAVQDIAEGQSKGFQINNSKVFAIKHNNKIFVYHNQCPHLGLALEWQLDRFLNHDNSLIQCASHGALFEIQSGLCIYGPCQGQYLQAVACVQEQHQVLIDTRDLP
ncbi:MAG: Rieske 2Fe-2S domain-containing protein [Pseudomonadota bacterium]